MKTIHYLFSIAILILAWQSGFGYERFTPYSVKACVEVLDSDFGSDKNDKENFKIAKQIKKNYGPGRIEVQKWTDGTTHKVLYPKDQGLTPIYRVLDVFSADFITDMEIWTVDGHTYYHGYNRFLDNHHFLVADKEHNHGVLHQKVYFIEEGGVKFIAYDSSQTIMVDDLDGNYIFSIPTDGDFHVEPAIPAGINRINVDDTEVEIYSAGVPARIYQYDPNSDYSYVTSLDGKGLYSMNLEHTVAFGSHSSGYFAITYDGMDVYSFVEDDYVELGGKPVHRQMIVPDGVNRILSLEDANGKKVLTTVFNLRYNTSDHSLLYEDNYDGHRCTGAVFLRDSTLNIPPRFHDAGYVLDSVSGKWTPYVRRTLFKPSEPYVAGMNTEPDCDNEGEAFAHKGKYFEATNFYKNLPDDYAWTIRDLQFLMYCAVEDRMDNIAKAEYYIHRNDCDIDQAKLAHSFIENNSGKYCLAHAKNLFSKVISTTPDAEVKEYATILLSNVDKFQDNTTKWANRVKDKAEEIIAVNELAIKDARAAEALRQQYEFEAQQAVNAIGKRSETSFSANLMLGILSAINNAFGQAKGMVPGNNLHVTYTEGAGTSTYCAGTVSETGSTQSSGASVETAPKCSACNGTGQCNACRGHAGYATAAKDSHKCHGCNGSGRCYICGGSGYKR